MAKTELTPLAAYPSLGRSYSATQKVRTADTTTNGVLRLDGLARYSADVSEDDVEDVGLPTDVLWLVRKTTVDVIKEAEQNEELTFTTWASGASRLCAERRLSVSGSSGARYEMATIWVAVEGKTGRPVSLPESFFVAYHEAIAGRRVSPKLAKPEIPATAEYVLWPLRVVDYDVHGHVNNVAYWPAVEELLDRYNYTRQGSFRVQIEFRQGVSVADSVKMLVESDTPLTDRELDDNTPHNINIWWVSAEGDQTATDKEVAVSATVRPLPANLY